MAQESEPDASAGNIRSSRQQIEDRLREGVERAIAHLTAAAPEQKRAAAGQLQNACTRLSDFILMGKIPEFPD